MKPIEVDVREDYFPYLSLWICKIGQDCMLRVTLDLLTRSLCHGRSKDSYRKYILQRALQKIVTLRMVLADGIPKII